MQLSIIQIILLSISGLLLIMLPILFFQHRRSERVMSALKNLLFSPERAKVNDARIVIENALGGAISKITTNFNEMTTVLGQQIARAENLEKKLGVENKMLVGTADSAAERIANMTRTLENLVVNLNEIVERDDWTRAQNVAESFNTGVNVLIKELDQKAGNIIKLSSELNLHVHNWTDAGHKLSDELQMNIAGNTDRINMMSIAVQGIKDELSGLQHAVISDFENVKISSNGIGEILTNNDKLLSHQLENMENFTVQSKKLLQSQVNTLSDTANRIGTSIRLSESSIENETNELNNTTDKLTITAKTIKETFDSIANEIMGLRAKFQAEVGEFSTNVVTNLNNAQAATTRTMENAGQIASEFGEKIIPMLGNINETVKGLEIAKDRILPLSELMSNLNEILPSLMEKSDVLTVELSVKLQNMSEQIKVMNESASQALRGIGDSTMMLEKLSGQSRQQMIDLMDDYAKATNTMRELGNTMSDARVQASTANVRISQPVSTVSVQDFIKNAEFVMEKLHDLSVDLTRSIGAEIPDTIMKKYNDGDRAIFSKWFAKMISSADRRRVKDMFKTDAVFRSQATQFVHGFAKMMAGAERTENKEMVISTLLKTDLGVMYQALRASLS